MAEAHAKVVSKMGHPRADKCMKLK